MENIFFFNSYWEERNPESVANVVELIESFVYEASNLDIGSFIHVPPWRHYVCLSRKRQVISLFLGVSRSEIIIFRVWENIANVE